jgi:hypothetical protein
MVNTSCLEFISGQWCSDDVRDDSYPDAWDVRGGLPVSPVSLPMWVIEVVRYLSGADNFRQSINTRQSAADTVDSPISAGESIHVLALKLVTKRERPREEAFAQVIVFGIIKQEPTFHMTDILRLVIRFAGFSWIWGERFPPGFLSPKSMGRVRPIVRVQQPVEIMSFVESETTAGSSVLQNLSSIHDNVPTVGTVAIVPHFVCIAPVSIEGFDQFPSRWRSRSVWQVQESVGSTRLRPSNSRIRPARYMRRCPFQCWSASREFARTRSSSHVCLDSRSRPKGSSAALPGSDLLYP